jgi:hypothetical protein
VGEEEGEGHSQTPELTKVVGVAAKCSVLLYALALAIASWKLQEGARSAGRSLLSGVALAGSICVRDEVAAGDLSKLALAKG